MANDLQKLSIWFQNCHVHVILRGSDVPLNLKQNPYVLTLPNRLSERSIFDRCARGRFAIPASTKMVSPCQTTIFYINLFQVSAMAYNFELVLAEECTRVYKLKDRHSINLVCTTYVYFMQRNGNRLDGMPTECQKKRIHVLRSLNHRLKYIPIDHQLASYVRKNLTKPKTALLSPQRPVSDPCGTNLKKQ